MIHIHLIMYAISVFTRNYFFNHIQWKSSYAYASLNLRVQCRKMLSIKEFINSKVKRNCIVSDIWRNLLFQSVLYKLLRFDVQSGILLPRQQKFVIHRFLLHRKRKTRCLWNWIFNLYDLVMYFPILLDRTSIYLYDQKHNVSIGFMYRTPFWR